MRRYLSLDLVFVFLLSFVPASVKLGKCFIQPTADLWVQRSVNFISAIGSFDFASTYQQYHPGVTVMWLTGVGSWFFYKIYAFKYGTIANIFDYLTFPQYWPYAKFPLVVAITLVIILTFVLLKKLLGRELALLSIILLTLEPFFIANVRSVHLDALLGVLMFVSILLFYLSLKNPIKSSLTVLTGVFFGLSLLTKVVALYLFVFAILVLIIKNTSLVEKVKRFLLISITALITFFVVFPAMWVDPIGTLFGKVIYMGVYDTGVLEESRSLLVSIPEGTGLFYHIASYPLTIIYRMTPVLTVTFFIGLIVVSLLRKTKSINLNFLIFVLLYGLGYLLMMTVSTKKIYRYVFPIFPVIAVFGAYGIYFIEKTIKGYFKNNKGIIKVCVISATLLLQGYTVFGSFPHFFAYFNPLLGGIKGASKVVSLNQDGTGYFEVARFLNSQENAEELDIASYDWKILGILYKGKTYSVKRSPKPLNTDYILLPIQRGQEYLDDRYKLEKTFKINGVDYWFLYSQKLKVKN